MTRYWQCRAITALCCLLAAAASVLCPRFTDALQPESTDATLRTLLAARSLKCVFSTNAVADWKEGTPKLTVDRKGFEMHFDSIDTKAQKARLIGNQGAADLTVFATRAGLHFMEQTGSGNIAFTTVFASRVSEGFIAVASRHVDLPGGPIPSQYHGVCKLWQ
jgi:hypothetical protein